MTAMKAIIRVMLLALFFTPLSSWADDAAKPQKLTTAELQVMAHYHAVNMLEVQLGTLAKQRVPSQAVKSYAAMLVKDHRDADGKLKTLAKQTKQLIPAEKPATDADKQEQADTKKAVANLKKLKGADFEREYLRMMVDGHDKELAKIDTKIGEVQKSELADMLRGIKPTLQAHADQARELQKTNASAMR
jgi:putative membrane protein